jgi:serine phosphatase RsbU (regulator of sigma subunit)
MSGIASPKFLIPISGPPLETISLTPRPGGQSIGRHDQCDIKLPNHRVSRMHARFIAGEDEDVWFVSDLGSRWGTLLNGVPIESKHRLPLQEGDLIFIAPWTFRFSGVQSRAGVEMSDDPGLTRLRPIAEGSEASLNPRMLELLIETVASFHTAVDEAQLSKLLIDAALIGTGLENAVLLRPIDAGGNVEVVMSKLSMRVGGRVTYSRSLLIAAAQGKVVELSREADTVVSHSIVSMQITAAICIPIMIGSTPSQFLYLDSRAEAHSSLPPHSAMFCVTLGRMASLALSHLKRVDIERRQSFLLRDLEAAAIAQKWILPKRKNQIGSYTCIGESRAGQYIGGDFFDLMPFSGERVGVALGDVSGKGVAASVLMTAAQGFLHAAILDHGDPGRAMTSLNQYISARREGDRFVTLWVGVLDPIHNTLCYVDAGHGYALLQSLTGDLSTLNRGDGLPIGVDETRPYHAETIALPEHGRIVIVSDGIIEQPGSDQAEGEPLEIRQFGNEGLIRVLKSTTASTDTLSDIFAAVRHHADTDQLSDDATAVLIDW